MEAEFTFSLGDDGTIDTVIEITCGRCGDSWERRYNPERPEALGDEWEWDRVEDAMEMAREDADSEGCPKCNAARVKFWDEFYATMYGEGLVE